MLGRMSLLSRQALPLRALAAPATASRFSLATASAHSQNKPADDETHETQEYQGDHYRVPRVTHAARQPRKHRECENETLYVMAVDGEWGARRERLVREIMRVDGVTWQDARAKVDGEINEANDHFAFLVRVPYKIGVFTGLVGSVTSVPLVFHKDTAVWFNDKFVHEDLPEGGLEDLDTFWKVGSWTWNWMEPYLGTASFVLLGMQFTRVHLERLHLKPYTERVLSWRANRLADRFPHYNRNIVRDYSKADPWDQ
eukprot:TRINITY_DN413_c1_g1_i2.p1 TRINITY_DN413_c1_g1~~TRINITY_DN413_c1_g1_i2.p1  ORF type:complete len:269 (-),score=80.61 TRINITY_DN413_c1_g1_i2:130-897(-)